MDKAPSLDITGDDPLNQHGSGGRPMSLAVVGSANLTSGLVANIETRWWCAAGPPISRWRTPGGSLRACGRIQPQWTGRRGAGFPMSISTARSCACSSGRLRPVRWCRRPATAGQHVVEIAAHGYTSRPGAPRRGEHRPSWSVPGPECLRWKLEGDGRRLSGRSDWLRRGHACKQLCRDTLQRKPVSFGKTLRLVRHFVVVFG